MVDKDVLTRKGASREFALNWDHKLLTTTFTLIKYMQLYQQCYALTYGKFPLPDWSPDGHSWRNYPEVESFSFI
jgi:hypothetical protein